MKCQYNSRLINVAIAKAMRKASGNIENNIKEAINQYDLTNVSPAELTKLENWIGQLLAKKGIQKTQIFTGTPQTGAPVNSEDNTTQKIEKQLIPEELSQFNKDYMEPFNISPETATNASLQAKISLRNSILFNGTITVNSDTLDSSINDEQTKLFNSLTQFLLNNYDLTEDQSKEVSSWKLQDFNKLKKYYSKVFQPDNNLLQKQLDANNGNELNKNTIQAYINYMILDNFDDLVKDTFGDAISINDNLDKFYRGHYSFANSGTNVYTTWRNSDNIDLGKEINKVAQLLIETTPICTYGTQYQTGKYVAFNQFNNFIGKLKELANNPNLWNEELFEQEVKQSLQNYSFNEVEKQDLQEINSMGELLTIAQLNPQKYLREVFEILNNTQHFTNIFSGINSLNSLDKNIMYSIGQQFFTGANNLYKASIDGQNWYSYLTEVIATINQTNFQQYFEDDQGVKNRQLQNNQLDNIRRGIDSRINTRHYKKNYSKKYDIQLAWVTKDTTKGPRPYPYSMSYTIGLTKNIHIVQGKQQFRDIQEFENNEITIDGKVVQPTFELFDKYPAFYDFINNMLNINAEDPKIIEGLCEALKDDTRDSIARDLFKMASNVLFRNTINQVYIPNTTQRFLDGTNVNSFNESLDLVYPGEGNKFQMKARNLGPNINLVSTQGSLSKLLDGLSKAQAYSSGMLSSTTVKTGENTTLSSQGLSSLDATYRTQWTILKEKNGAAGNFSLIKPGILRGVSSVREYLDTTGVQKNFMKFTPAEMFTGLFVYSFKTLFDANKVVNIIGAVNSDKPKADMMAIDLNTKLPIKYAKHFGDAITYFDIFKKADWKNRLAYILQQEFGSFYNTSIANIEEDYKKLFPTFGGYNQESFDIINKEAHSKNMTGYEYLQSLIKNYNYTLDENGNYLSNNNPVAFTDQVHYIEGPGGDIYINKSLYNAKTTFNNESEIRKYLDNCEEQLFNYLLKDNIKINYLSTDGKDLFNVNPEDKSDVGYFRLGKITVGGIEQNIYSKMDLYTLMDKLNQARKDTSLLDIKNMLDINYLRRLYPVKIELNPEIARWNHLGFLFSQEWRSSLVGMHFAHPSKYKAKPIILYGYPHIGKTTSATGQYKDTLLDFDLVFKDARDKFLINLHDTEYADQDYNAFKTQFLAEVSRNSDLNTANNDNKNVAAYIRLIDKYWELAKKIAVTENKILIASPSILLKRHTSDFQAFVKGVNIPKGLESWYKALDTFIESKGLHTTNINGFLDDGLKGPQFKQYFAQLQANLIADESSRYNAQHKRNVSYTATMHLFQLNQLNGVPEDANIAIIKEDFDLLYNLQGRLDNGVSPYDGATFTNPIMNYLENDSLNGSRVGNNKKIFIHYYDPRTGNGGIVKTAGFSITNNTMRASIMDRNMAKNMMDRIWKNEDGTPFIDDITKPNIFGKSVDIEGMICYNNGNYIRLNNLEYKGNNNYTLHYFILNNTNTPIEEKAVDVTINSNYSLWQALGGFNSATFREDGKYIWAEDSLKKTAEFVNNTVVKRNPNLDLSGAIITQQEVYQPLKHSDIHYMPVESSVKQGAANVNDTNVYHEEAPNINFMHVKLLQSGIQLDKEHEADDEDISLMTQVISACAARGFSYDTAKELYKGMAALVNVGLSKQLDALNEVIVSADGNTDNLQKAVLNIIVKNMINQKSSNTDLLYSLISKDILEEARKGKLLDFNKVQGIIPYSDTRIYKKIVSIINVALTNSCIKIKIPGILSVLCPSYNRMMLYGNKMLTDYKDVSEIQHAQLLQKPLYYNKALEEGADITEQVLNDKESFIDKSYRIETGKHYIVKYKDGSEKDIFIDQPFFTTIVNGKTRVGRQTILKGITSGEIVKVTENIVPGRNLSHYNIFFTGKTEDGKIKNYSIYDLEPAKELFKLQYGESNSDKIQLRRNLQQELFNIKSNGTITIHGKNVTIQQILEERPAEVILPKTMKSKMGLDDDDTLSKVLSDRNFFANKALFKFRDTYIDYDIALKRFNGNHFYINYKKGFNPDKYIKVDAKFQADPDTKEIWRMHNKKKLYRVNSLKDEIYSFITADGIKHEILVTDDDGVKFQIENASYQQAVINPKKLINIDKSLQFVLNFQASLGNLPENINDDSQKPLRDQLKAENDYLFNNQNVTMEDLKRKFPNIYNNYNRIGNRQRASFQKLLEIVAARIPAQSMQSFMPMKIIGFDNSDTNTAYVSTSQIWLQGSDYDIDSVSMTSYELNDSGEYQTWSPLAKIDSLAHLRQSDNIPLPSGKVINQDESAPKKEVDIDELINFKNGRYSIKFENLDKIIDLINYVNDNDRHNIVIQDKDNVNGENPDAKKLDYLIDHINKHNTYLSTLNQKTFEKAVINYMTTNMYKVAVNPANQIEASTPIDNATKPIKKKANSKEELVKEQNETLVGNTMAIVHGIRVNQVGKTGVGICAVGLKSFFAATQVYNNILTNGTLQDKLRSFFDVKLHDKDGNEQHYTTIANAFTYNYRDSLKSLLNDPNHSYSLNTEEVKEIGEKLKVTKDPKEQNFLAMQLLLNTNQDVDQAVTLSALLSLATDNAKELVLAKLNAGQDILGIYIYGIMIGVDFDNLNRILTSESILSIVNLLDDNVFLDENKLSLRNIARFIAAGPSDLLPRDTFSTYFGNMMFGGNGIVGPKGISKAAHDGTLKANTTIDTIVNTYVAQQRDLDKQSLIKDCKAKAYRYMDVINNYLRNRDLFTKGNVLQDFITLYKGSDEIKTLGAILHINQGLYTSLADSQNYLGKIENLLINIDNKEVPIDLHKFLNDAQYQEEIINKYNKLKQAFNIPLILARNDQYMGYLKVADLSQAYNKISARFRAHVDYAPEFNLSTKNYTRRSSRLDKAITEYIYNVFFNKKGISFTVPAGFGIYKDNVFIPITSDTQVLLGTKDGNATFKRWIEDRVIPLLKLSKEYKNNLFIKELTPVVLIDTLSENNTLAYSLPINMSPRIGDEAANNLFNAMQQEFLKLNSAQYVDKQSNDFSIQDLLFLYNLISNQNTPGEFKLTSIFSKSSNYGLIKDFTEFENWFDRNAKVVFDNGTIKFINAARESYKISKSNIVISKQPGSFSKAMFSQADKEDIEYGEDTLSGIYKTYVLNKTLSDTDENYTTGRQSSHIVNYDCQIELSDVYKNKLGIDTLKFKIDILDNKVMSIDGNKIKLDNNILTFGDKTIDISKTPIVAIYMNSLDSNQLNIKSILDQITNYIEKC